MVVMGFWLSGPQMTVTSIKQNGLAVRKEKGVVGEYSVVEEGYFREKGQIIEMKIKSR